MIRRITQIATMETGELIVALCNDGTLWCMNSVGSWCELPNVPQGESDDPFIDMFGKCADSEAENLKLRKIIDDVGKVIGSYIGDWPNKSEFAIGQKFICSAVDTIIKKGLKS